MGRDIFFITTAIQYVNDEPHVGTAYEIIACDFIARYRRLRGDDVHFLTGTDEHGLKVARVVGGERRSRRRNGSTRMVPDGGGLGSASTSRYDDFIRTSEPRHYGAVASLRASALHDRDEIYLGTYEGPYCVVVRGVQHGEGADRRQLPDPRTARRDLERGELLLPALDVPADRLLELYAANPVRVDAGVPPERGASAFVARRAPGLLDLPPGDRLGHPVAVGPQARRLRVGRRAARTTPPRPVSATDPERFERMWPADLHIIGKDIVRFHAVIWPAMLMAAGLEVAQDGVRARLPASWAARRCRRAKLHRHPPVRAASTTSASTRTATTSCARSRSARTGTSRGSR